MVRSTEEYNLVVLVDYTTKARPYLNDWVNGSNSSSALDNLEADSITWLDVFEVALLLTICILGTLGNSLIAFTLLRRRQLKYPSNRFVLSLNISSLIFCLLVLPFAISSSLKQQWPFDDFWCQIVAFLATMTTSACSPTIALIALDRYVAIVRPMTYTNVVTIHRSTFFACLAWLFALAVAFPPLFEISSVYDFDVVEKSCTVKWNDSAAYTVVHVTLVTLIPVLIMFFCYSAILQVAMKKCQRVNIGLGDSIFLNPVKVARQISASDALVKDEDDESIRRERQRVQRSRTIHTISGGRSQLSSSSTLANLGQIPSTGPSPKRLRSSSSLGAISTFGRLQNKMSVLSSKRPSFTWIPYQSPRKGLMTVMILLTSFILTLVPNAIGSILSAFKLDGELDPIFHRIAAWLGYVGFSTNPLLYGIMNRAIRLEILPALWSRGRNNAFHGLPRKNSKRRISGIQTWDFPSTLNQWKSSAKGGGESRRALPTCQSVVQVSKERDEREWLSRPRTPSEGQKVSCHKSNRQRQLPFQGEASSSGKGRQKQVDDGFPQTERQRILRERPRSMLRRWRSSSDLQMTDCAIHSYDRKSLRSPQQRHLRSSQESTEAKRVSLPLIFVTPPRSNEETKMLRRKSGMGSNSDSGVGDEIANADSGSLELDTPPVDDGLQFRYIA